MNRDSGDRRARIDIFGHRIRPLARKIMLMLDKIINLVHQNAGEEIVRNPAIPDQYNEEAINDTAYEIDNELRHEAKEGNVQNLAAMFQGNTAGGLTSNPAVKSIISNLAGKFTAKFGISPQVATSVAAGLVPKVLNQFINKTNDPQDGEFNLQDVLKNFTGNSNIGDLMGHFSGSGQGDLGKTVGGLFGKK